MTRCPTIGVVAAALCAAILLGAPERLAAQPASGSGMQAGNPLPPDIKGMVGVGLLGGELGMVIPALAGAKDTWAYIVFPVVGAGGGAVAGYFLLEHGTGHPELAVASLAAGMALFIPSLVLTIAETRYEPDENSEAAARTRAANAAGPGLVRFTERGLLLAPPAVTVGSLVSADEALRTGAPRNRVTRASLVSGVF
jgi:hypothetical protein